MFSRVFVEWRERLQNVSNAATPPVQKSSENDNDQYHRPGESRHLSEDSESRTLARILFYVALNCVLRQSCSRELSAMLAPPTNASNKVSGRLSSAAAIRLRERAR
jgi:hypothetical protein